MKWINASDKLPSDQQEVLIKINGHVSLARYNSETNAFRQRNGHTVPADAPRVEWMELIAPYKN